MKKLLIVVCSLLVQIGCTSRAPLKSQPIFTSTRPPLTKTTPPPAVAKIYKVEKSQRPVVVETPRPTPVPQPIRTPQPKPIRPTIKKVKTINAPPKPISPAAAALVANADKNLQQGNLQGAIINVERALRIEPRNAMLTYKLATLRYKESKTRLAEDLAKKAALLAGGDVELKKRSWTLIARIRRQQQDLEGARQALQKAESFGKNF